jgi:hypothetical protein
MSLFPIEDGQFVAPEKFGNFDLTQSQIEAPRPNCVADSSYFFRVSFIPRLLALQPHTTKWQRNRDHAKYLRILTGSASELQRAVFTIFENQGFLLTFLVDLAGFPKMGTELLGSGRATNAVDGRVLRTIERFEPHRFRGFCITKIAR